MNGHPNPALTVSESNIRDLAQLQKHTLHGSVSGVQHDFTRITLDVKLDNDERVTVRVILSGECFQHLIREHFTVRIGDTVQIPVRDASIQTAPPWPTTLEWTKPVAVTVIKPAEMKEYRAPFLEPTAQSAPLPQWTGNADASFGPSATHNPASTLSHFTPASHMSTHTLPSSRDAYTSSNSSHALWNAAPAVQTQRTNVLSSQNISTADPSATSDLYASLASVPPGSESRRPICVIGVVDSVNERFKTRGTDWIMTVEIKDEHGKLTINLFGGKDDLPTFVKNEIVVLQQVKMTVDNKNFTNTVAAGRVGGYQVARYHSTAGTGTLVPDDGTGIADIRQRKDINEILLRCQTLANRLSAEPEKEGTKRRAHRLLNEVIEGEYFECTVEVLQVRRNYGWGGPPITLEVTDYSSESLGPMEGGPCIVTFGMWDEAGSEAEAIKPGEFYHLRNVRRMDNGWEFGKQVEKKIVRVRDEEDSLHIVALIERQSGFEI
ncbi:hypothetical protein MKEN_01038700 [Mycena kentingensis (nom. inval.)]|nr:hypothetical protein MKEN_01038700 [Mycena kentingensis (nom. inval.)]